MESGGNRWFSKSVQTFTHSAIYRKRTKKTAGNAKKPPLLNSVRKRYLFINIWVSLICTMEKIVVYSPYQNSRLTYVLDWLLKERLQLDYSITHSKDEALNASY